MITKIEVDGFKTFHDFALELAPFQVIVGANGSGKSNLFDALQLLAKLADTDLRTAFQSPQPRGEPQELFAVQPDGTPSTRMRFGVELLVEPQVRDDWGDEEDLKSTRLRYDLEIVRHQEQAGLDRLSVADEKLAVIRRKDDDWLARHVGPGESRWRPTLTHGRTVPFISTERDGSIVTVRLHQDGRAGRPDTPVDQMERTVLSGVANTDFPHALAVRQEMLRWQLLQLSPEVLREPCHMLADAHLQANGGHLPSALRRMEHKDQYSLTDVSRDLANLVPEIVAVRTEEDKAREQIGIRATMEDGRSFSSRVMSDGTLRMLALAVLRNDPEHGGTICFEEPENGVHPFRVKGLVQVLRDLATDFRRGDDGLPLRQLLVNTHSPTFMMDVVGDLRDDGALDGRIVFCHMVTRVDPRSGDQAKVTRMSPVRKYVQRKLTEEDPREREYTLAQVVEYLQKADAGAAVEALQQELGA